MFLECRDSTESNVEEEVIPNGWGWSRKSAESEFSTCSPRDDTSRRIGRPQPGTCADVYVSVQKRIQMQCTRHRLYLVGEERHCARSWQL